MALRTQEVTLRVVFDDEVVREAPADWGWESSLTVSHVNVNAGGFVVSDVQGGAVQAASADEVSKFNDE